MKKQRTRQYKERIDQVLDTPKLRDALHKFGDAYAVSRENAFARCDFEAMRSRIADMKDEVRQNRQRYLEQFATNAEKTGAKVFVARTAKKANDYIVNLARERGVRKVVKSKSMVSEEIYLNDALDAVGVETVETDLGEWIIQLAGQKPSHMVMPAIHMFRDEVAELFSKATGRSEHPEITHLVDVARRQLRREYLDAEMGISGANVAIAETGALALITNEGNARLVTTLPKIHVALIGIEKLVPNLEDADDVFRILPKSATGQAITSYVTWIRGAVPCGDGQKELHIVLVDNGRSALADDPHCNDALRCIRCGACANVCPVYQTVGGHVFGHVYIGAIGIILTSFVHGLDRATELVRACIGCRACVSVCPAKIDLETIILHLREKIGETEGIGAGKTLVFRKVMRNRKLFHSLIRAASLLQKPATGGERVIRHLPAFFSTLTEWRTLPAIAEKPLRDSFEDIVQKVDNSRYRVAFFAGCANDFLFPEIGHDLVKVLNHLGVLVIFPEKQNCCGIPALYSGDRETATELARQNVNALLDDEPDYVVTTCPTCTMALQRDFVEHLKDDPLLSEKARRVSEKTVDAVKFIADILEGKHLFRGATDPLKVTYHDSCHLKRGAGIWKEPRALLQTFGHDLVEMAHADRCCGFGGSYSFSSHPAISRNILSDKLADIEKSGATCVAMDCPGCLLQIRGGLDKTSSNIRAAHTIELLSEIIT